MAYQYRFVVRMASADPAGVLFFPELFRHAHDAYEAMFAQKGLALHKIIATGQWHLPVVRTEADFLRPIYHGEQIEVEVRVSSVGTRSYQIGYQFNGEDSAIRARLVTTHVVVDPETGKSCSIPETLRTPLESMLEPRVE